ncbi:alpha/beta fold hydrolase [Streptomyces sp. VRA16 Mangrove soil]|uniref:alpha/beta fold hydrolase n=1 Tax=Streptomyces sp. VRA16 Mangrove soil TaxID=2817434 RepID=UPI001A9D46EE|nr:alpha/beta hydrolase [Streptomyces sp. VRA16 Mangrove soil]MBO1329991.1 alpha/beta hydrolase [Streptomyces sp. VRA16 Mangrove soil]
MSHTPVADLRAESSPLSPGTHAYRLGGLVQRYHVHGSGPVCVVHPGGPGIFWEYLRIPALEEHLTMVYVEPIGTTEDSRLPSHPHGYTRERYSAFLDALISRLGVPKVHLLGHSHGAFVAAYHALHHPERLAGVVLYEGAPVTGPEHGAEAGRRVEQFALEHKDEPELPAVLAAFGAMGSMASDADTVAVARGVFPSYVADYWGNEKELAPVRDAIRATYVSGLDEDLSPDVVDDRAALPGLTVPALVVVGLHDVICSPRWAFELDELIPDSRLLILRNSGHFGHIEEPEPFADAVRRFVTDGKGLLSPVPAEGA